MKNLFAAVISLLIFISCTDDVSKSTENNAAPHFEEGSSTEQKQGDQNSFMWSSNSSQKNGVNGNLKKSEKAPKPKIIYSADLTFQVADVTESTSKIKAICDKHAAHIAKMNLNSGTYRVTNRIKIRVSEESFDKMINDFERTAVHVDEMNIKSDDVTAEFIDIQSRLKTKKTSRDRYIEVLKSKAGTVEEIIDAEEAIRVITEEIEAKEGRLRYLTDKVKFSTITLDIYEVIEHPKTVKYVTPYIDKAKDGFENGWSFLVQMSLVLINIWPLIIAAVLIVWKRKWLGQKFRGNK